MKINFARNYVGYIFRSLLEKAIKVTVVNRTCRFINKESLEITFTVPLMINVEILSRALLPTYEHIVDQHVGQRRTERQEIRDRTENSWDPPVHQAGDPHHDRLQSTRLRRRQVGHPSTTLGRGYLGHPFK